MSVTFKADGLVKLNDRLNNIVKDMGVEVRKAINQGALMIRSTAREDIKKISFGRVYGRKVTFRKVNKTQAKQGRTRGTARKQKIHIASKPGDAPNADTGNLWRNIKVSRGKSAMGKGYYQNVRAGTPYAIGLEFGTDKVKARPFMKPALLKNQNKIIDLLEKAKRKALNR